VGVNLERERFIGKNAGSKARTDIAPRGGGAKFEKKARAWLLGLLAVPLAVGLIVLCYDVWTANDDRADLPGERR
jgi:hypothetical protein